MSPEVPRIFQPRDMAHVIEDDEPSIWKPAGQGAWSTLADGIGGAMQDECRLLERIELALDAIECAAPVAFQLRYNGRVLRVVGKSWRPNGVAPLGEVGQPPQLAQAASRGLFRRRGERCLQALDLVSLGLGQPRHPVGAPLSGPSPPHACAAQEDQPDRPLWMRQCVQQRQVRTPRVATNDPALVAQWRRSASRSSMSCPSDGVATAVDRPPPRWSKRCTSARSWSGSATGPR